MWLGFSFRLFPVFSSILFLFILKNSLVLANDKHTHNMMLPSPCLKIWRVVLSDVLCWTCTKHNALYSRHKVNYFPHCSITLVPYCKQDSCFRIFVFCTDFLLFILSFGLVLWSNYNVVDSSSVFTAIKLCNLLKSPLDSLSDFLPLWQLS